MTRPLNGFLGSGDALARLHDHAARLRRLQVVVERLLPPALTDACAVANYKNDTLILLARNGAAAAKLKQLTPSLIGEITAAGVLVKNIQVKVQIQDFAVERPAPVARTLSESGKTSLSEFSATLPEDSPLRQSIERLLARSRSQ